MKQIARNSKIQTVFKAIKPWVTLLVIFFVLRYTGILGGISYLTNSALMKTGVMDISPEENAVAQSFNYNFKLKDLKGNEIKVSEFKDKVIFLNMWATWCGPCRVEMPSIQSLYEKTDHEKIVFIMLSIDKDEDTEKIRSYVDTKAYSFPVYQPAETLPRQLQVTTIPTTFIIGKDGKIKTKKVGTANYDTEEFKSFLESLAMQSPDNKKNQAN